MDLKEKLLKINTTETISLSEADLLQRIETFTTRVFIWLGVSLLIAFGIGYLISYLIKVGTITLSQFTPVFWISAIGGFVLVILISWFWEKFSYNVLAGLFILFAVLEGIGLTGIFLVYTQASILTAFITTSSLFFVLVILSNFLKIDVTKWTSILLASLIALIIGMIINLFWNNGQFAFILNIAALIIFSLLVILDMKIIKQAAIIGDKRLELVMALSLYLDFINIFITILRMLGERE